MRGEKERQVEWNLGKLTELLTARSEQVLKAKEMLW